MGFLSWILLGSIAGILAKFIMPTNANTGFIAATLLGIAGAFIGGWLGSFMGLGTTGEFSLAGIVTAVIGALVLLFAYGLVKK
jgi:uncharacterized membrane protein YeaQ/YmgE (transglycosylase-associated protein family)